MANRPRTVTVLETVENPKPGESPIRASTEVKVNWNTQLQVRHVTPDAVRAIEAQYVAPVRIVMRYFLAAVISVLAFLILLAVLTSVIKLDPVVAATFALVAGAAIGAPLGILVSKVTNRILEQSAGVALGLPEGKEDKTDQG